MSLRPSLFLAALLLWPPVTPAGEVTPLAGTQPLTWQGDLADKMMDGLHTFVERKVAQSVLKRPRHWKPDPSSPAAYAKSVEPKQASKMATHMTCRGNLSSTGASAPRERPPASNWA